MSRKLYYLASPYTHAEKSVMKERAFASMKGSIELFKHGIFSFAPIAYNSPWEEVEKFAPNFEVWEEFDKAYVERCSGVIVLMIDGWDRSIGVTEEIRFAKELNIPVYYTTQKQLENGEILNILKG